MSTRTAMILYICSCCWLEYFSILSKHLFFLLDIPKHIYQAISRKYWWLQSSDAGTIANLYTEVKAIFGRRARVVHTKTLVNWSKLSKENCVLRPVKLFSRLRYIYLSCSGSSQTSFEHSLIFVKSKLIQIGCGYRFSLAMTPQKCDSSKILQIHPHPSN